MKKIPIAFLVIAIFGAIMGFGGFIVGAVLAAKVIFYVFITLFIISIFIGLHRG